MHSGPPVRKQPGITLLRVAPWNQVHLTGTNPVSQYHAALLQIRRGGSAVPVQVPGAGRGVAAHPGLPRRGVRLPGRPHAVPQPQLRHRHGVALRHGRTERWVM